MEKLKHTEIAQEKHCQSLNVAEIKIERLKTLAGDWKRSLVSKNTDKEKGEGFNTTRIL